MAVRGPVYPSGERGRILGAAVSRIKALPWVDSLILFGSYAKGTPSESSDVDLAVFVNTDRTCLLAEYRQLTEICRSAELDIQVQVFRACELDDPCGIIEEIVTHGIDLSAATE